MKAVYEKKESSNAELKVTVDGQQWTEAQEKAMKKVAAKIQVPGFRKGHVPAAMVERYINRNEVMLEAAENVAQQALEFGLDEYKDIRLVDRPSLDIENISDSEVTLKFLLTVYPDVELGDYKAVAFKPAKVTVSKKEVDQQIEQLRLRNASEVLKEEGKVEKGNIAVIDFEGFVDGVAFEGGKGTDYPLEIGSGSFIPGFEDQLIGLQTGEEKDVNVTFPEQYAKELAGKDATFKVKINGIKEKVLPELNDEFVADLDDFGDEVKTVEDLTKTIKKAMKDQRTEEAESKATDEMLDGLCDVCKVDIPEVMIERELEETLRERESQIASYGMRLEDYLKIIGQSRDQFRESLREVADKKVRIRLILDAIGEDMKVKVTDEEIEAEYKGMSEKYKMEVEKIKELISADMLSEDVRMQKTLDTLKKNNKEAKADKE
ncbi:MAG: trigger factor [Erysipelotrichaceae bacterium]|nr:trigger factor [Erysipelotrichaceae bacterium]